jgi:ribosomal protein L29
VARLDLKRGIYARRHVARVETMLRELLGAHFG